MPEETQGVEEVQENVQSQEQPEADTSTAVETPTTEGDEYQEDEMPTEPDKQREAFIKMRQEIKELKSKQVDNSGSSEDEEAILNQFRQRQVPQMGIDAEAGSEEALYQMNQLAQQAQYTSQEVAELKQQLEDERLFGAFPELNPANPDFKKPENRAFEKHLAGLYVLEQLRGNSPDLVSLAHKAKADFGLLSKPQQEAIAQQIQSDAAELEQATTEARGNRDNIPKTDEGKDEALRYGARRGDVDAIANLLKG